MQINYYEGARRATFVISTILALAASLFVTIQVWDRINRDFHWVIISGLGVFIAVWGIYLIIKYIIQGFYYNNEVQTKNEPVIKNEKQNISSSSETFEREPIKYAMISFAIQFIIAATLFVYDSYNFRGGQMWTGTILGWGCLYTGIKFRKIIIKNISKYVANWYTTFGVILLFVGGAIPGAWIVCLLHQGYGYMHKRSYREYSRFYFFVALNMITIYLGAMLIVLMVNKLKNAV